jgi:hypothetical protein
MDAITPLEAARKPFEFPIIARLCRSDTCNAEGITVRSHAPVLAMCRELISAGYDSTRVLEAYRGDMLCVRVRSIGEGAKLTVKDNRFGTPTLHRWREGPLGAATAPPVEDAG